MFAIPTSELWNLLPFNEQGFIKGNNDVLDMIVRKSRFLKRSELEEDPSFKQLIPYGIISFQESFFLFRRTAGQTEKRLSNKLHLGVGGHVNPGRQGEPDAQHLVSELKRELSEEVIFMDGCGITDIEFIGFINDDTIPVGTVHIGLLYNIRVSGKGLVINETDKMTGLWTDRADFDRHYGEMETWSQIAFDSYLR